MSHVNEQVDEIDKFYAMKNEYETKRQEAIRRIMSNTGLTVAEKRERIAQLKLKCQGCKGVGGTNFYMDASTLKANCGAEPKCGWQIEISKGEPVAQGNTIIDFLLKQIEDIKKNLIFVKVSHEVSNVNDDAIVAVFENSRSQLEDVTRMLIEYDSKFIDITNNVETANEINLLKVEVYELVQQYKELLRKYEDSGREAFLMDAMNTVQDILPKVTLIRNKKYRVTTIVTENDGTVRLVQDPYTLADTEMVVPKSMMTSTDAAQAGFL